MKLTYHRCGDYLLPDLTIPDESVTLGKYGRMRKTYLKEHKEHKPILYNTLLLSGKLTEHLMSIQEQAQQMEEQIITQMAKAQGVTEKLKQTNMMTWVGMMNNIKNSARETVLNELIYTM